MKKLGYIFLFFLPAITKAQTADEATSARFSPKEFAIPTSPVFDMMGVAPTAINRASDIKDFKVDWSFKSWKLSPNLALQGQPFWEIMYSHKDLKKYQEASKLMRRLSTLDISIGTVQDENNDRRLGIALKLNLYKQKDPLLAQEMYVDIGEKYGQEKKQLQEQLTELKKQLDTTKNILNKPTLRTQILGVEQQLLTIPNRRRDEIGERAKVFISENWNASSLDIAVGKIQSYQIDSAGTLKSLRLNRNTGFAAWVNGSLGLGKRWLLSGLIRTTWYEEQLHFSLEDTNTGDISTAQAIAENQIFSVGANMRYGGPLYSFFMEFMYETKQIKTATDALDNVFKTPNPNIQIVNSSVKWTGLNPNNLTVGGEWKMNRNVILNYGMRCIFDKNWKFTTFAPIASISCLMR